MNSGEWISLMLGLAAVMAMWRFAKGPHLADRLVASDQWVHIVLVFLLIDGFEDAWLILTAVSAMGPWLVARWMESQDSDSDLEESR